MWKLKKQYHYMEELQGTNSAQVDSAIFVVCATLCVTKAATIP